MTFGEEAPAEKIDTSELCYIQFYVIDNQAKIYIDGELKHDSGPINSNQDSERTVSLSEGLSQGSHKLTIELYNGEGLPTDSYDRSWKIHYEAFVNGEPIEYINERKESAEIGLVWSKTRDIFIQ
ncbi:MAG: hypothetical protein ACI83W_002115 [Marinoscillum sp.]|jgi:hypothetical protein